MITWKEIWIQQEHSQELLRETQTERLLQQARMAWPRYRHLRRQALIWLGQQLVAWGQRLQRQSGVPSAVVNLHSAHSAC